MGVCGCPQVKENNYRGHSDSVDQLCWHPTNPDLFVTASGDKTIRIWDVRTTKCMATVNTKGGILFLYVMPPIIINRLSISKYVKLVRVV